jgi:hypothetical protein
MILSNNEELNEYVLVRELEHIAKVWPVVAEALPKYWERFVDDERPKTPAAKLAKGFGGAAAQKDGAVMSAVFEKAIDSYEKEASKYRQFFTPEAMEEFYDDPNAFKQGLSRDVPVIANTLRQRHAELKEWQMHFRSARPNDLLEVFANVVDFSAEWRKTHPTSEYSKYDAPEEFELYPLDTDESMGMVNVVGMGIKSIMLFHLDPERLPPRGRNGLYGLYFLSGRDHFGLPSKSSEFLMINDRHPASDGSIIMDQNYWYPYSVFSLYVLRIFRWLEQQATKTGFAIDRTMRYVYVERFLAAVCDQHADDLKTMRAHERFEIPA